MRPCSFVDNDLVALDAQIPDRLAQDRFGLAVGIDIGRVDEIDAGIERTLQQGVGGVWSCSPTTFQKPSPPKVMVPRRIFGNDEAGTTEFLHAHGIVPAVGGLSGGNRRDVGRRDAVQGLAAYRA